MCDALVFEPLGSCNQTTSTAFRKHFGGNADVPQLCVQPLPFASTWVFNGTHPASSSSMGGVIGGGTAKFHGTGGSQMSAPVCQKCVALDSWGMQSVLRTRLSINFGLSGDCGEQMASALSGAVLLSCRRCSTLHQLR